MPAAIHTVRIPAARPGTADPGSDRPLVLVPALGGTWRSWSLVTPGLAAHREVVALDLPGFGDSPPLPGPARLDRLADALQEHLDAEGLAGADLVGSSLGGRMVLELARRGVGRHVVALGPGGFWDRRQKAFLGLSLGASIGLVRALQPVLPVLLGNPVTRGALLAQLSARPWALPEELMLPELRGYTAPGMLPVLRALVREPSQAGPSRAAGRVTIGWGRQDRVTTPSQAARALHELPGARLHWFSRCGHFPIWDRPDEAVRLVLDSTGDAPGGTY